jgi:hypothetical protein
MDIQYQKLVGEKLDNKKFSKYLFEYFCRYKNEIELYEFDKELVISSVDRQDAGLYSCIVSNNFGTDRRYFNIIISGK